MLAVDYGWFHIEKACNNVLCSFNCA